MKKFSKRAMVLTVAALVLHFALAGASGAVPSSPGEPTVRFIKEGAAAAVNVPLSRIGEYANEPIVGLLAGILFEKKDRELEKEPLNAERDVTIEGNDRGTYLNQIDYLKKAGIDPEKVALEYGTNLKETINKAFNRHYTSLVDIDNDGVDEIRFHSVQGTLYVESNYFFKKRSDGGYELLKNDLDEEDCGGEYLSFVRCKNKVYTIRKTYGPEKKIAVYIFRDGAFRPLYFIEVAAADLNVKTGSGTKVEKAVAAGAAKILADLSGEYPICGDAEEVDAHEFLGLDAKGTAYMADIDNDGKKEIILKEKGGRANWMNYSGYAEDGGKWFEYDMKEAYEGFKAFDGSYPGSDLSGSEDFIVKKADSKNYLLKINEGEGHELDNSYEISIFIIEDGRIRREGTVETSCGRAITIKEAGKMRGAGKN